LARQLQAQQQWYREQRGFPPSELRRGLRLELLCHQVVSIANFYSILANHARTGAGGLRTLFRHNRSSGHRRSSLSSGFGGSSRLLGGLLGLLLPAEETAAEALEELYRVRGLRSASVSDTCECERTGGRTHTTPGILAVVCCKRRL